MAAKADSQATTSRPVSDSELTCSVCLEQFKDPKVLPCCHTFCRQCLQPLVKRRDSVSSQPESTTRLEYEHQPYPGRETACETQSEHTGSSDESSESMPGMTLEGQLIQSRDTSSSEDIPGRCRWEGCLPTNLASFSEDIPGQWVERSLPANLESQLLPAPVSSECDTLSCPQCRTEHQVPEGGVDGFLTDFSLVHDIEVAAVLKEKEKKPSCGQCESSDPSVAYCVQCEAFLCEFCSSAHKRMKLCKEHSVLPLNKISADVLVPSPKPFSCGKHPSEDIKLYCKTCQQFICRDCALVDHCGHDYHFAHEERQGFEKALEKIVNRSRDKRDMYEKDLQKIRKVELFIQSAPENVKKQITAAFDEYMLALQSRREALLKEVDSEYQADSKKVWAHKEFTETAFADLTASLRFAERASQCSSDTEMIILTKQAMQRLESLSTREHKLNDTYEVVDNTVSYNRSHIERQLHTCDSVVRQRPSLHLTTVSNYSRLGEKATITLTLSNCNSIRFQEVTPTITITYGHSRKRFKAFTVTKTGEGIWTVTMECICGGSHAVSASLLKFSATPTTVTVNGEPASGARVRPGPDDNSWTTGEGAVQSVSTCQQYRPQQYNARPRQIRSNLQQYSWRVVCVRWDDGHVGQYRWGGGSRDTTQQYAVELVPTTD